MGGFLFSAPASNLLLMSLDKQLPVENVDALKGVDASAVKVDVQAQLSKPADISAANQFFKGNLSPSADKFLPSLDTALPVGADAGLGAAPGLTPGAEQMSPLIQMIMKMPGHISLVGSFFEVLGAFFAPMQEALTNVFDPSMFNIDAGGMLDGDNMAFLDADGGDFSAALDALPADAPILQGLPGGEGPFGQLASAIAPRDLGHSLFHGSSLSDSFMNAPSLEVSGPMSPGKSLFEGANNLNFAPTSGEFGAYTAMGPQVDPSGNFGSTVGNSSGYNYQQNMPMQQQGQPSPYQNYYQNGAGQMPQDGMNQAGSGQEQMPQGEAQQPGEQQAQEASESTTPYTVKSGDNLWDIAREHLGDGTRWPEIYKLNEGIIGDNPRLIMPGAELQLPGGASDLAQADYTVKPGDNLWDISKEHLGGGEHWPELYKENTATIGSNPDLIHPGDKLHMPAGDSLAHNQSPVHTTAAAPHHQASSAVGNHHPGTAGHHANHVAHKPEAMHQAGHGQEAAGTALKHAAPHPVASATPPTAVPHAASAPAAAAELPPRQASLPADSSPIIAPQDNLENLSLSAKAQSLESGT